MAVKIRTRGAAAAKPVEAKPTPAKRSPAKRASTTKAPTTTRRTSRTASAKPTPAKKTAAAPKRAAAAPRGRSKIDPRTEAKLLKMVQKMGERRAKAEIEHKESINALHQAAKEALEGGVSMGKVSEVSGISRQWLYKMGEFRGRNGSTATASKASASKPATKPAKRTPPVKTVAKRTSKPAANGGTPRRRIAIRSAS